MVDASELAELRTRAARLRSELAEVRTRIDQWEGAAGRDGSLELLTCAAGDRAVAFPLASVEQVILVPELLPIPDAPAWVAGLLRFRGALLTVVDVRARLEGRAAEVALSDSIVIGSVDDTSFALLVQDASGVCSVPRSELKALAEPADSTPYVLGLVPIQDRVGWLLSLDFDCGPDAAAESIQQNHCDTEGLFSARTPGGPDAGPPPPRECRLDMRADGVFMLGVPEEVRSLEVPGLRSRVDSPERPRAEDPSLSVGQRAIVDVSGLDFDCGPDAAAESIDADRLVRSGGGSAIVREAATHANRRILVVDDSHTARNYNNPQTEGVFSMMP